MPTAAELLIKCLEKEGVEFIFGIPGEENLHVMDALRNSSIEFITVRHEQGLRLWPMSMVASPGERVCV